MSVIIIVIFIVLIFLTRHFVKDSISRFFIYCFLFYWNISLFASCFNPFGIKDISNYTYIILITGMLSFYLGFFLLSYFSLSKTKSIEKISYEHELKKLINSKFTLLIYLCCAFFTLKYARNALVSAAINGEAVMDGESRTSLIFMGSGMANLFYNYIITPFFHLTLSLLSLAMYKGLTKSWTFYILSVIFIGSFAILAGGRVIFMVILMYLTITYVISHASIKQIIIPKKIYIIGIFLIGLAFIGMSFQTGFRKTGEYKLNNDNLTESASSMMETFAVYSLVPIKLFDLALSNNVPEKLEYPYFGRATIAGTDEIICGVLKRITGYKLNSTAEIVSYTQETWIEIIPGRWPFNYCYTALFYNYMDYGILGVILFPFFMGLILRYFILQFWKTRTLSSIVIISFGFFMMMHSLFTDYFIKNWAVLYCVILIIWQYLTIKNNKKKTFNPTIPNIISSNL